MVSSFGVPTKPVDEFVGERAKLEADNQDLRATITYLEAQLRQQKELLALQESFLNLLRPDIFN